VMHFLGAALGGTDEAEAVHQLRVWTRRADAALKLFRPAVPAAERKPLRKLLRKLRRSAGKVRDCDVHAERLKAEAEPPPKRISKSLKQERRAARRKLQVLRRRLRKDDRLQSQAEKLLASIAWPKRHSTRAAPPFAPWCRLELAPLAARFFELAERDLRDDDTLHALRIAGKRLRYALELSAFALHARACRQLDKELSAVQDRLGEVRDRLAVVALMRGWLADSNKSKASRKLRKLVAVERERLERARRSLLRWWTPARRSRLQRRWNAIL
jgi:CHAD domain-containing protein